jgi:apolipoprotein D and lipocalin family protein
MKRTLLLLALPTCLLAACTAVPNRADSPVPLVQSVDLPRFMGAWYVIAHIPPFFDRNIYNAVESYTLAPDGRIQTTYRRRKGGFDAKVSTMHPTGYVVAGTQNALWGMQFVPLIRGEYRIAHLEPDYSVTIIGRSKLDMVWLMSRQPEMREADYQRYVALIHSWGYDVSRLERIPQRWPEPNP